MESEHRNKTEDVQSRIVSMSQSDPEDIQIERLVWVTALITLACGVVNIALLMFIGRVFLSGLAK